MGGAFVFALGCPPTGASVGLNMLLSSDPQASRILRMQAEGQVLRLEQPGPGEKTSGFATRNQKMVVLRGSEVIDEWIPSRAKPNEMEKYARRSGGHDGNE